MNFGLTGCLEMIVITNEIIEVAQRLKRGIEVTPQTLGLEAIREVGHQGHYLTHAHTMEHLRSTQWRPNLFARLGHETWEATGRQTLLERATVKLNTILAEHRPSPLKPSRLEGIQAIVDAPF